MEYMFNKCNNLKLIDISNININFTANANKIFHGFNSLEKLILTNLKAHSNNDLSYMFNNKKKLKFIDLSNFSGSSINTTMEYMFNNCENLIELDLSKFIYTPWNMDHMFNGCSSLKYLNLSKLNYSYNKIFSYMFNDCQNLEIFEFI